MAQTHLRLDSDHLVACISSQSHEIELHFHPDVAVGEGQRLVRGLEQALEAIVYRERAAQATRDEKTAATTTADWIKDIVRCGCGRSFPQHGLGALGKHASQCAEAKKIQISTKRGTIYRPVVKAIEEWSRLGPFTVPEMCKRFATARAPISYSGLRTHVDYLVDQGRLETEKTGRTRRYFSVQEVMP